MSSAMYFTDRCGRSVEVSRDTFVPCGLKAGHAGKCVPVPWPPEQTVSDFDTEHARERAERLLHGWTDPAFMRSRWHENAVQNARDLLEAVRRVEQAESERAFAIATLTEVRNLAEARVAALQAQLEEAEAWLGGLAESFAGRCCEDEAVDKNGEREGNTCIDSEPGDLEFPDDWCWRCYVLKCVTEARAAVLAGRGVREPEPGQ